MSADGLLDWNEFVAIADGQENRWIVEGVLRQGELTLFYGAPYSGKTTTACQLMASVATGRNFLGHTVPTKSLILFINADGAMERTLRARLQRPLQDEDELVEWGKRFFTLEPSAMALPLTTTYLREKVQAVQKRYGSDEVGLIVIDGLRTGFLTGLPSNAENDAAVMSGILRPIRMLAKETGWSILLLHHSSKGTNDYSGSAAIAGCTEGLWGIDRNELSKVSIIKIKNRDEVLAPFRVVEDETGLHVVPTVDARTTAESDTLKTFVELFPDHESLAMTQAQAIKKCWVTPKLAAKVFAEATQRQGTKLERLGTGKKGSPFRYYRVSVAS